MRQQMTDRFDAQASDGERCTIVEHTTMMLFEPVAGQQTWTRGARSYVTSTGRDINPIDNDHFEDVLTRKVFTRVQKP